MRLNNKGRVCNMSARWAAISASPVETNKHLAEIKRSNIEIQGWLFGLGLIVLLSTRGTAEGRAMNDDDRNRKGRMDIPGERVKPWAVWRVSSNGSQIEKVAEADTSEELRYKRRQNWHQDLSLRQTSRLAPPG
jgi:hypothetical protein